MIDGVGAQLEWPDDHRLCQKWTAACRTPRSRSMHMQAKAIMTGHKRFETGDEESGRSGRGGLLVVENDGNPTGVS